MIEQELRQALIGLIEFVTVGPFPHLIGEPGSKPTHTAQSQQSLLVSFLRIKPFLEKCQHFSGEMHRPTFGYLEDFLCPFDDVENTLLLGHQIKVVVTLKSIVNQNPTVLDPHQIPQNLMSPFRVHSIHHRIRTRKHMKPPFVAIHSPSRLVMMIHLRFGQGLSCFLKASNPQGGGSEHAPKTVDRLNW